MFEGAPDGHASKLLHPSSSAEVVKRTDISLYNLLVSKSEQARQHLVSVGVDPRLVEPEGF